MSAPLLRRTDLDAQQVWIGCRQVALAALLQVPLPWVRPVCPGHSWMSLTNMRDALEALGVCSSSTRYAPPIEHLRPRAWPMFGLVLLQFRGPWGALDASMAVVVQRSFRYSHWVAISTDAAAPHVEPMIGDLHAVDLNIDGGWLPRSVWKHRILGPLIKARSTKTTGGWWVRSGLDVDRASAASLLERTR